MTEKSNGMDWKSLEEKPDNWEMIQQLIGAGTSIVESMGKRKKKEEDPIFGLREAGYLFDTEQIAVYVRDRWKKRFGPTSSNHWLYRRIEDAASWTLPPAATVVATGAKKKAKKGVVLNKADQIRLKNSQRLVEKDIEEIRFEPLTGYPVRVQYRYEITTLIMLLEWWLQTDVGSINHTRWVQCLVSSERILMHIEKTLGEEECLSNPVHQLVRKAFEEVYTKQTKDRSTLMELLSKPKMMMFSLAERRTGSVNLYPQQVEIIDRVIRSILEDHPLLIGNRMPPGTGKTFMAVPMAQAIRSLGRDKTLLFCCPNPLVNKFVASTTLIGHDLHLWIGKFFGYDENNEKIFMVRPHKRCFPASWKKIYKDDNPDKYGNVDQQFTYYSDRERTGRVPDMLVCDPTTCLEFLKIDSYRDRFVAFIDEVIGSLSTTEIMTRILRYLPEQAVVMSAILPRFEDIPFVVDGFHHRHSTPGRQAVHHMIDASGVTIACTTIDPEGRLSVPHHHVEGDLQRIPELLESLSKDPLIRRMYAPFHIVSMLDLLEKAESDPRTHWVNETRIQDWKENLPTLGKIDYPSLLAWWILVLQNILEHQDVSNWEKIVAYRPMVLKVVPDFSRMFSDQAFMYKSKHLHILENKEIYVKYDAMCRPHLEGAPSIETLVRQRDKRLMELQEKGSRLDGKKKNSDKLDSKEKMQELSYLNEEYAANQAIPWPSSYVMNSQNHFRRFHRDNNNNNNNNITIDDVENRDACILPRESEDAFSEDILAMMISGSILYEEDKMTEHQRRLALRVLPKMNFIVSGREVVFGTNIDGLTGLSIDQGFSDPANRSVLLQLIGRIGRVGMSYEARIMIQSWESLRKIMHAPSYHPIDNPDPDVHAIQSAWFSFV